MNRYSANCIIGIWDWKEKDKKEATQKKKFVDWDWGVKGKEGVKRLKGLASWWLWELQPHWHKQAVRGVSLWSCWVRGNDKIFEWKYSKGREGRELKVLIWKTFVKRVDISMVPDLFEGQNIEINVFKEKCYFKNFLGNRWTQLINKISPCSFSYPSFLVVSSSLSQMATFSNQ